MKQYTAKVIDEIDEYVTGELIVKGENYYIRQTSEPQNCKCGIGVFAVLKETIKEVVKTEAKEDVEQMKSVLISTQLQWSSCFVSNKKTIEVRKSEPDEFSFKGKDVRTDYRDK